MPELSKQERKKKPTTHHRDPEKKMKKKQKRKKREKEPPIRLYDGELGGRDIKGVDIGGQSREGLLCSIGPTLHQPGGSGGIDSIRGGD